jgi:cysteinyl-tRNA synthetase
MHDFVFDVLGLESQDQANTISDKLTGVVSLLIQMRNEARAGKDFATSDKIRDELAAMGIQLKDGKEGTTFSIS